MLFNFKSKVKSQDNAGQQSSDSGGLNKPCKLSWGTPQFIEPVACLHLFSTVQPFALALSLPVVLLHNLFCSLCPRPELFIY